MVAFENAPETEVQLFESMQMLYEAPVLPTNLVPASNAQALFIAAWK